MSFNFIKLENRKYELTPSTSETRGSFSGGRGGDDAGRQHQQQQQEEEAGGTDAEGG